MRQLRHRWVDEPGGATRAPITQSNKLIALFQKSWLEPVNR